MNIIIQSRAATNYFFIYKYVSKFFFFFLQKVRSQVPTAPHMFTIINFLIKTVRNPNIFGLLSHKEKKKVANLHH